MIFEGSFHYKQPQGEADDMIAVQRQLQYDVCYRNLTDAELVDHYQVSGRCHCQIHNFTCFSFLRLVTNRWSITLRMGWLSGWIGVFCRSYCGSTCRLLSSSLSGKWSQREVDKCDSKDNTDQRVIHVKNSTTFGKHATFIGTISSLCYWSSKLLILVVILIAPMIERVEKQNFVFQ